MKQERRQKKGNVKKMRERNIKRQTETSDDEKKKK
jgi:hypothetical protein